MLPIARGGRLIGHEVARGQGIIEALGAFEALALEGAAHELPVFREYGKGVIRARYDRAYHAYKDPSGLRPKRAANDEYLASKGSAPLSSMISGSCSRS
jgi:hypothetical protein